MKFMHSEYHPFGGVGKDHEHKLLLYLRRKVEKLRSVLLMMLIIPGTRVYSTTFFGCTYNVDRDSTFDADKTISCWKDGWWWAYAFVSFIGMILLLITALIRDKRLGSMEHPYPATRQYGFFLSMTKILATITAVGMGEYHTKESCLIIVGLLVIQLIYLLREQPWAHAFINRFSIFGVMFNIICYGTAVFAVHEHDRKSNASASVLSMGLLGIIVMYLMLEIYRFTQVPDRESPAGGFGQHHVAWRFTEVYRVSRHGMPLDSNGMDCEHHYDIHTGRKKSNGSGKPAAITSQYQEGGRPPRYYEKKEKAAKIKETEKARKLNEQLLKDEEEGAAQDAWQNPVDDDTPADTFENEDGESSERPDEGALPGTNRRYVQTLQAKPKLTDRELRKMLGMMSASQLMQRAEQDCEDKITEEELHAAIDQMPHLEPLVDLIYMAECSLIGRETVKMSNMSLSQLRLRATHQGLAKKPIDSCLDQADPKAALIEVMIRAMDTDGDGEVEQSEVAHAQEKVATAAFLEKVEKSSRNIAADAQ
jgi:hypothetical protein